MDVVIGPCKARMASVMMILGMNLMGTTMTVRDGIERKLTQALEPSRLTVSDRSAEHAGHMGHSGHASGETHFHVEVVSRAFAGKSRVERNRMIYALLADEFAGGMHALSMITLAPDEVAEK